MMIEIVCNHLFEFASDSLDFETALRNIWIEYCEEKGDA